MKDPNVEPDGEIAEFEDMDLFADDLDERYNGGVSSLSSFTTFSSTGVCLSSIGSVATYC